MNILLIDDERALVATAVLQLELKGHTVYPAYSIAEARKFLGDETVEFQLVIADHRLEDGLGVQFVIAEQPVHPRTEFVVVSGCLTETEITMLQAHGIPYFLKPLLYGKMLDALRRARMSKAPFKTESRNEAARVQAVRSVEADEGEAEQDLECFVDDAAETRSPSASGALFRCLEIFRRNRRILG